jgi:hypothetical protein
MSYAEIKPQYYKMFQPDSPWHAGAPGWKDAPWPGWGRNPNLVGPPRLGVEGLGAMGAYFQPQYEKAISGMGEYFSSGVSGLGAYFQPQYEKPISGLGASCGCAGKAASGVGDTVTTIPVTNITASPYETPEKYALILGIGVAAGALVYFVTKKR